MNRRNVVSQLQSEINRVFGNLNNTDSNSATSDWSPAVDVREYSDRFQLLLDVPGVEPKDVEITLDHGVLSVAGNRTEGDRHNSVSRNQAPPEMHVAYAGPGARPPAPAFLTVPGSESSVPEARAASECAASIRRP